MLACKDKKYFAAKAVVVDTKHNIYVNGLCKVEVYYKYLNGKDSITAHSTADGLQQAYTSDYYIGDSLKIGYNSIDSSDTFIVKKTFNKPRN